MAFRYDAIDPSGSSVSSTIEAGSLQQATELLREKGLFVMRLDTADEQQSRPLLRRAVKPGGKLKDVIFFTQQMSMMLRSGARVVQAMDAIEVQTQRPRWRKVLESIRADVEEGRPLSSAVGQFPRLFPAVYVNIVAAGEASGNLGLSFERLATLMRQQQDLRNKIVGALTYPAVLMCMCTGVILVLFTFVLPRFAEMFSQMDTQLPMSTQILIASATWARTHAVLLMGGIATATTALVFFMRGEHGKRLWSRFTVRVPVFGFIVRNVVFAQICRIWGQLLDSKVGLVEAVELTGQSTRSLDFRELLEGVRLAITQGESIGPPLKHSWLLPRTFAAAIATGEESGKLADALLFVAGCLEEENEQVLASLTRLIEPIMLLLMGGIVGTVAVSLFLPMFDMAAVAGH